MKSSLFWLAIITIIWVANITPKKNNVEIIKIIEPIIKQKIRSSIKQISTLAQTNLGKPYVYGKIGPESYDCSGFVYAMHQEMDILVPRTSLEQSKIQGEKISRDFLLEGDLVFFDTANEGKINHSGIYLGDSKFIHASSGKAKSVTISSLDAWYKDKFKWGKRLNANK